MSASTTVRHQRLLGMLRKEQQTLAPTYGSIPSAEQQEEKVQEQNRQIEKALDESKISKRKQKRRVTSYLSSISKQLERQGNQINKIALMIQSLQRQMRNKPTTGVKGGQSQQLQPVKKVQSQSASKTSGINSKGYP